MSSSPAPERWIARAQVWLGTLVEIALPVADATEDRFAAAFASVAHVHRTMSAHDKASDLAQIGLLAHRRAVKVDRATYSVLQFALALSVETGGLFDVTIAPVLARRGLLPRSATRRGARCGRMRAMVLERGSRVRTDGPVAIDLGGIAKGYAVDCAVGVLQASGVMAGIVNAGGDLRAFGSIDWTPVRIRHPTNPAVAVPLLDVRNAAVATSAARHHESRGVLVDARTKRVRRIDGSVSVIAPTCMVADALTKVVALCPARAASILARHGAHAFCLGIDGDRLRATTTCFTATSHLRLAQALAA